jgi:hypothetical protein
VAFAAADFTVAGVNTANTTLLNLKATSTRTMRIMRVGVFYSVLSANAQELGLKRMNAVGTGAITSTAGADFDNATPVGVLETAWATTRPTLTGTRFARELIPLTIGAGFIWDFGPQGILIPVSGGMCLEQITASGATLGTLNGFVHWDE